MESQSYRCARIPTREMFVSFFRDAYDRNPSWVNPVVVRMPYSREFTWKEFDVDEYGGVCDRLLHVTYYRTKAHGFYLSTSYQDRKDYDIWLKEGLYGGMNLTCDEYCLRLYMGNGHDRCADCAIMGDVFKEYSTSAHERVYVTHQGNLLMPIKNITKREELLTDFYLEFRFTSDTCERLRRLYADGLLVDYSTAYFSSNGPSVFKKEKTVTTQATVKKEEKIATPSRNVFSTKDIIDGSAISMLIEALGGKN